MKPGQLGFPLFNLFIEQGFGRGAFRNRDRIDAGELSIVRPLPPFDELVLGRLQEALQLLAGVVFGAQVVQVPRRVVSVGQQIALRLLARMLRASSSPRRAWQTMRYSTGLVESTGIPATIGDRRWKGVLEQFYQAARNALAAFGGREIDSAGDGLFASFTVP